jgi:ribose 5-phosphate isomerase B
MKIGVGADHAGFEAKDEAVELIEELGHEVVDYGTDGPESVDYPDYGRKVGAAVASGEVDRGIIFCGSGVGVSVAANKIPGVRAGVCHDTYSARQGVEHDDMNTLCLGARIIGSELIAEILRAFLGAEFSGAERHVRRLNKVKEIEADALDGEFGGGD